MNKEAKEFWKGTAIRSFTLFGFTFFATIVTFQNIAPVLQSSFIGAGLYFFSELMKYYKIQPDRKVITKSKTKGYSFMI